MKHRPIDTLFIMHHFRRSGAEIQVLDTIRVILEKRPKTRITVLTTGDSTHEWRGRLPVGVNLVAFGRNTRNQLTRAQQLRFLRLWLLATPPQVIHVVGSWHGWELLTRHGSELQKKSRLFATVYCLEFDLRGRPEGYPLTHLPRCHSLLEKVFVDNQSFANQLAQEHGIRNTYVLSYPAPFPPEHVASRPKRGASRKKLKLLWAARVSWQKRPDHLLRLARLFPGDEFHAYGHFWSSSDRTSFLKALRGFSNVRYLGPFDGLKSIPTWRYDALVYTTMWDGLPLLLLEAAHLKLPVIAPDIGGIQELIEEKTGYLVKHPAQYVEAIERLRNCPREAAEKSARLLKLVRRKHNLTAFRRRLAACHSYFPA